MIKKKQRDNGERKKKEGHEFKKKLHDVKSARAMSAGKKNPH